MKMIAYAALGAALIAGFATSSASASGRTHHTSSAVQAPVRADTGFRNSYNAYDQGYWGSAADPRAEGGAISAPAGR